MCVAASNEETSQRRILLGVRASVSGAAAALREALAARFAAERLLSRVRARVHGEIVKFVQTPDIRSRFANQGVELQSSSSPAQFTAYIKSEYTRWAKVLDDAGIKAE